MAPRELSSFEIAHILQLSGSLICDSPNEYLDKWDGNITSIL